MIKKTKKSSKMKKTKIEVKHLGLYPMSLVLGNNFWKKQS
jgi:hypothetical protein